ncbi:hypothetical protein RDABS01_036517, partial [Bienertia sinuspersici]
YNTTTNADLNGSKNTNDDLSGSLIGFRSNTAGEMLEIYEKHAALLSFSVRKHTTRYFLGTKKVMEKYFVCCAQELEGKKNRKPRKVSITRIDCKA